MRLDGFISTRFGKIWGEGIMPKTISHAVMAAALRASDELPESPSGSALFHHFGSGRQGKMERRAPSGVGGGPQATAM